MWAQARVQREKVQSELICDAGVLDRSIVDVAQDGEVFGRAGLNVQ